MIKSPNIEWLVEVVLAGGTNGTIPCDLQEAYNTAYSDRLRSDPYTANRAGLAALFRVALELPANGQSPILDEDDMHFALKRRCEDRLQKDVAAELGISTQYLTDLLYRRRNISNEIAAKFGYERRVVFVPLKEE